MEESLGLYIVADGMGGHLAGEVASQIAVDMIRKSYRKWLENETPREDIFGPPDDSLSLQGNYLMSSIRLANRVVYEMAMEYEQYHGMGTTVVVLLVSPTLVVAANVGDSRIYLVRDGHIEKLSKDHTIVAEQVEMGAMTEEEPRHFPAQTHPDAEFGSRGWSGSRGVRTGAFQQRSHHPLRGRIHDISGGVDALLLRKHIESFDEENAWMAGHMGWGTDKRALWAAQTLQMAEPGSSSADAEAFYGNVQIELGSNNDVNFRGRNASKAHLGHCMLNM